MTSDGTGHTNEEQHQLYENWFERQLEPHVVLLVDVLGIGGKVRQWSAIDHQEPTSYAPVFSTLRQLIHFHDMFYKYFEAGREGRSLDALRERMPPSQLIEFRQWTHYELGTQWFSDTFLFYAPTRTSREEFSLVPLCYFLTACCLAMLDSLAIGVPVRGALSFGYGVELGPHNFQGAPFVQAHDLESNCAKYPRVLVSQEILDIVENTATCETCDAMGRRMKNLARRCGALMERDYDGHFIVDYLGRYLRDTLDNYEFERIRTGVRAGYDFAIAEQVRFTNEADLKLAPRYWRLRQYMESRLHLWNIRPQ